MGSRSSGGIAEMEHAGDVLDAESTAHVSLSEAGGSISSPLQVDFVVTFNDLSRLLYILVSLLPSPGKDRFLLFYKVVKTRDLGFGGFRDRAKINFFLVYPRLCGCSVQAGRLNEGSLDGLGVAGRLDGAQGFGAVQVAIENTPQSRASHYIGRFR